MSELLLRSFIPKDQSPMSVELIAYLAPVVRRLTVRLPKDEIWGLFHSNPEATDGRVRFPYYRVDTSLAVCSIALLRAEMATTREIREAGYQEACKTAFGTVAWIEIGFEGLVNLARSPASLNWCHASSEDARVQAIMSRGRRQYERVISEFAFFRDKHPQDDEFKRYELESLLQSFKKNLRVI